MPLPGLLARHSVFVSHVATMMTGKSVAAAIALFTMPVIARLFSPNDFGVAAVFLSIVGITSHVAVLRYEMALVLPETEQEAVALMGFAYRVLFAVCCVMLLILAGYQMSGATLSLLELLGKWMWFLPLGVLLMAALQVQENWLARRTLFKVVAGSMVLGTVVNSGTRIGFGALMGSSVYGLITSNLLGMSCRLVVQKAASSEGLRATFRRIGWPAMRQIAHRYADFPKLNAPAALIFSMGQNLPVLLFGVMFSPAAAGFYAMANRLSQVPIAVVATSMRRVFLQKAAAVNNSGRSLRKAFLLSTGALALFGAVPFGGLWLVGQPLAAWLLGERWLEAGRYLEIIAPWLFMLWVTAPSNPIFVVLRKQKLWLFLQIATTVLRLGAFGLAYVLAAGPTWTLQAFVIATVGSNVATILVALLLISQRAASYPDEASGSPISEISG